MSNVENTIGRGLSKIQDGLDKGKNKVEAMKEISKLNKTIDDANSKKAECLLEVGVYVYKLMRQGLVENETLNEKCASIVGFDYIIYDSKKKIDELKKASEGFACSCGYTLTSEEKFCGGCGKKVELPIENTNNITCNKCDMVIEQGVNFCPCCGVKIN